MKNIAFLVSLGAVLSHAPPTSQPVPARPPATTTRPAERSAAEVLRLGLKDVRLERVPLRRALEWLAQTADVNVVVNWNRLAAIGVKLETPVTVVGQSLTVAQFLDLLTSDVNRGGTGLGYEAERDLIRVAPRQDLDEELVTRIYPVYDLLRSSSGRPAQIFIGRVHQYVLSIEPFVAAGVAVPRPIIAQADTGFFLGGSNPAARHDDSEAEMQRLAAELTAAITGSVEPDSWEVNGGRGTLSLYEGMLIVTNSHRVHSILGGTLISGPP